MPATATWRHTASMRASAILIAFVIASTLVLKAGAQCVRSARWDLCGGRRVTGVPTATGILAARPSS
jgi:hypothetical protein